MRTSCCRPKPQQAGKAYQVFGSFSGLGPTSIAGIQIPLTPDAYTQLLLANPQLFNGGNGTLNGNGRATLSWVVPAGLPLWLDGAQFHHAVVAFDATSLRDEVRAAILNAKTPGEVLRLFESIGEQLRRL